MLRSRTTRIQASTSTSARAQDRTPVRRSRVLAVLLATGASAAVLTAAPFAGSASAGTTKAPVAAPSCVDVLLLGARGSGQWAAGHDDDRGYGPQVRIAVDRLVADLRADGVTTLDQPVDYPAEGMQTFAVNPKKYWAGVEKGVTWVQQRVSSFRASCPTSSVALLGYSQGSIVMHRVLQRGVDGTSNRSWLGAAVLIADADRVAFDNTTNHGSAGAGTTGMAQKAGSVSGSSSTKLASWSSDLVHSVCNEGDTFCSNTANNSTHYGYKGTPEVLEALAEAEESLVARAGQ